MDIAVSDDKEIKDLDEESIWDLIESQRHIITSKIRPCHITPFLRQCRVIGETDEEEILFAPHLNHRYMRTGHMLDLLRTRGKKGGLAFLESLGFYNPEIYTLITGKEPTKDCSSILVEKGNLDLIQFLMNEVMKAQKWLGEEKCHRHRLHEKVRSLEDQNQQLKTELKGLKAAEANLRRIKMDWTHHHDEMIRLKEENYQILMRYTNTLQEKEMSVTRSRELYQQVDDLRMENKKLKLEFDVERRMSSKLREAFKPKDDELLNLKGEIDKLRLRIQELQVNPVTMDMLEQERVEAQEDKQDLMKEMNSLRLELDQAEHLRNEYLDEKENMLMECATLKIDCDMYKDKITSLQTQVLELQKERDEAYSARDEAQLQISKMIMDKDLCRRQVIELQDTYRELNKELLQLRSNKNKQEKAINKKTPPREKPKLKRLQAVNLRTISYDSDDSSCSSQCDLPMHLKKAKSCESMSRLNSSFAEPPSRESLYRRQTENTGEESFSNRHSIDDDVFTSVDDCTDTGSSNENIPDVVPFKKSEPSPESLLSMTGATTPPEQDWPFLRGPPHMKLMSKISSYKFNGDGILDQIEIIGGNSTGIFIHKIKPGSPAIACGLEPGFQIMMVENNGRDPKKTVLEDASLEEAVWTLKQIKGMCCLVIRHKAEAYQTLVENIEKKIATSGDSFYIRVNVPFDKESGAIGGFTVQCNEILHITNTIHKGNNEWKVFRVNPNTMADMEGGTIPNYYRAQQLMIGMIRKMMQQTPPNKKQDRKTSSSNQNKFMRIVSTEIGQRNPHWLSFDNGTINPNKEQDDKSPGNCFTLIPYSLVRPCHPPSLRPVIIAPTRIGKIVLEKLKDLVEYEKCKTECLNSTEYAAKDRKGDILGVTQVQNLLRSCYTRTAVEAVVAKNAHCLLELGLDCVKRLHKVEIYPIVIVIHLYEKNIKKIKKILQKYGVTEDLLLQCSRREESCLDTLPCLYNSIADGWSDLDSLVNLVKAAVKDEQKKIVWIEDPL
ncbi:caspase recruitment domain-containing protein 14 isoform X1 [Chiloscyllium plagiosum]|uniref:caspase recruitment domain-containing protein 14 isoform X1 n=1 Tax=Chiloscyllium plagiosum TaxID=36176 RepID=UPI001CB85BC5|nr:caspase recruitment domain-containing protein 14 isoform X1 [Chiloscyllium plagiosum]XP_043570744.1 caspase recruitment domain-containing protein 14 isoform X1 [Chiloscyllium plagiosum]XP_043570745.1 caspase recruitment domain-containing protein 14 isoform X1 [Chiloscyllium plagiosum]XP_043570746.1 caspase recruitment domain-containing protein 14 isoform X1 [Chiloscyllium plagiosum]XP_043570748.1 caspase recruitment domain-containing protein 14 isoform X1 [Chiloscyllium plagiosum]XP_0435707